MCGSKDLTVGDRRLCDAHDGGGGGSRVAAMPWDVERRLSTPSWVLGIEHRGLPSGVSFSAGWRVYCKGGMILLGSLASALRSVFHTLDALVRTSHVLCLASRLKNQFLACFWKDEGLWIMDGGWRMEDEGKGCSDVVRFGRRTLAQMNAV